MIARMAYAWGIVLVLTSWIKMDNSVWSITSAGGAKVYKKPRIPE